MTPYGRVIVGVAGLSLSDEEKHALADPLVFGVVLFQRNYDNKAQLQALTQEIKACQSRLLIFVDHEGAIWRFDAGFTRITDAASLGELWHEQGATEACKQSTAAAHTMASELRAVGCDLSFAPVVDLHYPQSTIIAQRQRALHADCAVVTQLAESFVSGLRQAGMVGILKHFPGHGYAQGDTHLQAARDDRPLGDILQQDAQPFQALVKSGSAAVVMMSHVIYSQVDTMPAVYSDYWHQLLRSWSSSVCVMSDCLGMLAVKQWSDQEKCQQALSKGCDIIIYSNHMRLADGVASVHVKPIPEVLACVRGHADTTASQVRRQQFAACLSE